ncbi:MAG: DegQ family serine endoprotease [Pontiellaceae bacterium]|nr:DegQ family serine endoprotease [Pontiellaceae bacterium]
MMKKAKLWMSGLVAVVLFVGSARALDIQTMKETGSAFTKIAKEALPAVVFIDVESTIQVAPQRGYVDPLEEFFGRGYGSPYSTQPRTYLQQGQGSGFIISKDGYILTNNHVVNNADRIQVTLGDGRSFKAELVGTDPETEVALIKIEDDEDFPFLTLGDSDELEVGEWVLAAGNPFGLSQTITAGIVSAKERSEVGITDYANFIQTDAAINPGNSGGPLLDIEGKVVGINTAIYTETGGYMGIGFALPINQAISIKDQLMDGGTIRRSVLGIVIQDLDSNLAETFGLEETRGILVSQVLEDSAAEEAGLKAGDIIVELNARSTGKLGSFRSHVASFAPDTKIELKIFRDGNYKTLSAVTQAMDESSGNVLAANIAKEKLGLAVEDAEEQAQGRRGRSGGVVVTEVEEGSAAWRAGIEPGQVISSVNRQRVDSAEAFYEAVQEGSESSRILLLVSDGRNARFVVIMLD